MNIQSDEYGVGDNSYKMAGELVGITKLVNEFYDNMHPKPSCKKKITNSIN